MANDIAATEGRPATVTVVAVFLFLAAAVAVVTGFSLLFPSPFWNRLWDLNRPAYEAFVKLKTVSGALLAALGVGSGFAGAGLLRRRRSAWWFAVVLFTINGLGDLVALFFTRDLIRGASGVLIAGAFLFCLTRPQVRRQFT